MNTASLVMYSLYLRHLRKIADGSGYVSGRSRISATFYVQPVYTTVSPCICSAQSENLRNLRIPRLSRQSRDGVTRVRNLRTLPVRPTASDLLRSLQDGRHP